MSRHKVLVIHALRPTSRQTTIDHLLAFREHLPNADVQYLHFAQPLPKGMLDQVEPDLLIVNYDYLNYRFTPLWPYIKNRHRNLARQSRKVVAIAQDEIWGHRLLDNWCMSWKIDRLLTTVDNDLNVLFPRSIGTIETRVALTGYAPNKTGSVSDLVNRPIDLGQRVRTMPPHLGTFAQEKAIQAEKFADLARKSEFVVDVSTKVEDSILGDAWPLFLRRCKFTTGMKGGASIADAYGLLYSRVEARRHRVNARHLNTASFRSLRRRDGKHRFSAVSPRLFEAAAAGTCQILRPDNYLDALEPWVHYIPLNPDLSDAERVLIAMRDLDRCQTIALRAQERLIASGEFGYSRLVETGTDGLLPGAMSICSETDWRLLSEFLVRGSQLLSARHTELHDAGLHLIGERLSQSSAVKSYAQQVVEGRLSELGYSEWYEEQRLLARSESLSWRSPWIWRNLPTLVVN